MVTRLVGFSGCVIVFSTPEASVMGFVYSVYNVP